MWLDGRDQPVEKAGPYGIMGILNVTPDSFYAGSRCLTPEEAVLRAGEMIKEGADIIDIGAESTRPGALEIGWREECTRLLPVLDALLNEYPRAQFSVDTRHARTADAALERGASIINDVSACSADPELLDVLGERKPAYVLMHAQGKPENMQVSPFYTDVVDEINRFFYQMLMILEAAGLPSTHVVIDPGIGFGKTAAHNRTILANMERFYENGHEILLGVSMKSLFGELWQIEMKDRANASALLTSLMASRGCHWHRVHDVKKTRMALRIADTLMRTRHHSQA